MNPYVTQNQSLTGGAGTVTEVVSNMYNRRAHQIDETVFTVYEPGTGSSNTVADPSYFQEILYKAPFHGAKAPTTPDGFTSALLDRLSQTRQYGFQLSVSGTDSWQVSGEQLGSSSQNLFLTQQNPAYGIDPQANYPSESALDNFGTVRLLVSQAGRVLLANETDRPFAAHAPAPLDINHMH